MIDIVFATNNQNKIKEIEILLPNNFQIKKLADIGCIEELPETHDTIEENSAEKANYIFWKYKISCFAEDSGLEINALNSEPGVNSAHYAGDRDANKNMDKVLDLMKDKEDRSAQFKTVITLILNGEQHQFVGILKGKISTQKTGLHGFGYDPIFMLDNGRTLAELTIAEKSEISHRAIATKKLVSFLAKYI